MGGILALAHLLIGASLCSTEIQVVEIGQLKLAFALQCAVSQ